MSATAPLRARIIAVLEEAGGEVYPVDSYVPDSLIAIAEQKAATEGEVMAMIRAWAYSHRGPLLASAFKAFVEKEFST